jgi:glycosyltransferase involved in cell wall biosynthesis
VICSDIGGMAEKVADGVNGLHFARADHDDLAGVLERAAASPGLWEELRAGIQPPNPMERHIAFLRELYDRLLADHADARPAVEQVSGG